MKKKAAPKKKHLNTKKSSKKFFTFQKVILLIGCLLLIVTGVLSFAKKFAQAPCANSISCINDLSGKITQNTDGVFMGKGVSAPNNSYFSRNALPINPVLGATTADIQHIYVDLSQQRLYAFQGNTLIFNFFVSTGKWHPTPTGTFRTWIKLKATRMTGGSGADFYDLPNVPWTMFFANDQVPRNAGFSLHGAYWYNNFGHPMSHGCINIRPDQAKQLFDWANPPTQGYTTYTTSENPGTLVTIYGDPPKDEVAY